MKIQELCTRAGVTKDTVRHYESLGLLKPSRRQAGSREYRHYDETSLYRLAHIANGKRAGFSLAEIRAGLDRLMDGRMGYDEQRATLYQQLSRIDEKIAELRAAKRFTKTQLQRIDRHEANKKR